MFKLKKINNEVVRPIPVVKHKPDAIKGYNLFPEVYCNIFICAKKKSGKTNVIFKIVKECTDKNTKVIIFSSTAYKDPNMIKITEWLDDRDYQYDIFTDLEDYLSSIVDEIENNQELDKETDRLSSEEEDEKPKILSFTETKEEIRLKIKKRKPKKVSCEYMFIFDDFSSELKDKDISKLLKQHRHYKSKVIISSQYPLDLRKDGRKQLDYWLLFQSHSDEKLKEIYDLCNLSIQFEDFKEIYNQATKEKYNFLYIDTINHIFRKNFNEQFILPKSE